MQETTCCPPDEQPKKRRRVPLDPTPRFKPKAIFGVIKGQELPERSYSTLEELLAAVRSALRRYHLQVRRR
ncbi:MAG TPA: hypothetical protein VEU33_27655 [Archangium sp.]|nr:hypothetical protein [Archangium sp.]